MTDSDNDIPTERNTQTHIPDNYNSLVENQPFNYHQFGNI